MVAAMTHQHVRFAFDNALDVSGSELLVLVALCEWANEDGLCWPSHDSIAKRARVSRRQVIRLVQSLVGRGLVEVDERRQRSNTYRIRCDVAMSHGDVTPDGTSDKPRSDTAMAHVTSDPDVTFGARDVTSSASHVTSSAPDVTQLCHPNNHIEPPERTTTKNHQVGARSETHQLVDAWAERRGFAPTNWGKASKLAKQLVDAGVTVGELMELYDWLEADSFWSEKGFDLGTAVSQLERFRQSKRTPRKSARKSQMEAQMDVIAEVFGLDGAKTDDAFETTGTVIR